MQALWEIHTTFQWLGGFRWSFLWRKVSMDGYSYLKESIRGFNEYLREYGAETEG